MTPNIPFRQPENDAATLQISTAQGPAECRIFARFVLAQILREARQAGVQAEVLEETADKHGILSALVRLSGCLADDTARRWQGTLQWVCDSPLRPRHPRKNWYIGVFRLPENRAAPSNIRPEDVLFQTCRAGGKGGQHVNKTESAVRATHTPSGISVRVESERSQHANKKRALELLALKLAARRQADAAGQAAAAHKSLYRVERGNPQRVFRGTAFAER